MPDQAHSRNVIRQVPELGGPIATCSKKGPPVSAEDNAPQRGCVTFKGTNQLTAGGIPDFGNALIARGRNALPIRTEPHRVHKDLRVVEGGDQFTRLRIPDLPNTFPIDRGDSLAVSGDAQ